MNTEELTNIVTPEEYYELLTKEQLNPKELSQKKIFENFIENCEKQASFLSQSVSDVYSDYQKRLSALFQKENQTQYENEVIVNFQKRVSEMENKENMESLNRVKKLDKAGYVNATIILVMILNIGFIIAMALLGSK